MNADDNDDYEELSYKHVVRWRTANGFPNKIMSVAVREVSTDVLLAALPSATALATKKHCFSLLAHSSFVLSKRTFFENLNGATVHELRNMV